MEQRITDRSLALDGLRGIAAAAVVVYHSILHHDVSMVQRILFPPIQSMTVPYDVAAKTLLTVFNGQVAVYVFFVLSGFVLRLSLGRFDGKDLLPSLAQFSATRVVRLYPTLIAALAFFVLVSLVYQLLGLPGYPSFTLSQFVQNATLWAITMHGPSNTIQAEVLAIPFLALGYVLARVAGPYGLGLLAVASLYAVDAPWLVLNLPTMHAYTMAFVAGMLAADLSIRGTATARAPWLGWVALAGLFLSRGWFHQHSISGLIAMVLAAAILVSVLYNNASTDALARMLTRPVFHFLGKISYSLYLLNVPVLYAIWAFTDRYQWPQQHPIESGLIVSVVSLALTIPVAMLSERYVEKPSIAWARRVGKAVGTLFGQGGSQVGLDGRLTAAALAVQPPVGLSREGG